MKAFFKDYFTFNKSERTGIIVLISVITVIASLPHLIKEKPADYKSDSEAFRIEIQEFLEQSELKGDHSKKATGEYRSDHAVLKFKPRLFNPNTASLEDYMQMGFSEKQAGTIIK